MTTKQDTEMTPTRQSMRTVSCIWLLPVLLCSWVLLPEEKTTPYTFQYPANFGSRFVLPEDNPTTQEGVALGRMLFYEKKLSANSSIACASCHEQRLAFTDGRRFSLGMNNQLTSRNSMSLANLLWVRNFFWDGRAGSLEEQAVFPLTDSHEMGQTLEKSAAKLQKTALYPPLFRSAFGSSYITKEHIVKAIAQFERTLISANSPYDRYLAGTYQPTEQELRGMALFMNHPDPQKQVRGANCGHCHGGPKTFKELFHNNGLDSVFADKGRENFTKDANDRARFRVPTLRNIALTAPYMHDGRFSSLEQVLDHYNAHVISSPTLSSFLQNTSNAPNGTTLQLTDTENADIIAFLHLLTDKQFVTNPAFSNPFVTHTSN